ncbi:type II CRISPR RNA-guided endonuclease Cas9 [Butyrivibrio sp. YAB3001]|uniref:type II CRISPR RNA-guided endonuclease Cas9 n=1 Tax=Butyrivibrio sp. YAB3001 TaxID=1520812 RepID=UPI0008F624E5|nr:type II CRISPR RNA-guided endonuclease Cas9 [Butyrivibrio sp. YAB3001]SFB70257.1 CRISPR-associated endonuclease Csn1 [Butyrivibrio sp. YAB3001]
MNTGKYYVGLDMGTSSVGWAVTDDSYVLQRAKGKDMWGVRLFSEAKTAEDRRTARIGRRRRQRQVARINYLTMCFAQAIEAVDSGFLLRLKESKYHFEDRSEDNKQKYAIFNDKDFNDTDYLKKYPTIFHLRAELLDSNPIKPHDVRLVYLALLNLFKHRGNFLNESLSVDGKEASMNDAYRHLVETASLFDISVPEIVEASEIEQTLSRTDISKKKKLELLLKTVGITKKESPEVYEILQLCCGMKGKLFNIFGDVVDEENKNYSFAFSDSNYEEKVAEIIDIIGDEYYELVAGAKEIYDIGILANIMKGEQYLSIARVNLYNSHHEDLILLKKILKKYSKSAYESFFRKMSDGNYSAYVGSVNSDKEKVRRNGNKGRGQDELYKTINDILKKLPEKANEDPDIAEVRIRMENGIFLSKQLTGSNGVIPNQVHAREMKKILENAGTYLPFLNERDESGLTVSERILMMFMYHIPYYVGPLGKTPGEENSRNAWAERKAPGKIYPWNISEKIDMDKAAEDFITRMLRKCTYLQNQETLPKQSLLYEKFLVLNELNNLKVNGEKITVTQKQDIYEKLFMKGKRVTCKQLVNYLVANGLMNKEDSPDAVISGIDGDFKSSLSSINKFAPIFGAENVYGKDRNMIEKIIFWGTVFGNDKKYIKKKLKEEYGKILDDEKIKRISGFSFTGWGNLSKEFLEMPGKEGTFEADRSIIISLWENNENLMELLGGTHSYREELERRVQKSQKEICEWIIEDLDDMYLSPSVKRMVWQTLRILKDIYSVSETAPDKIFVEMPREDGEKGKRTQSRKKKLEELYKGQKEFLNEISQYEERDFKQKKLYLYYLQNGKSMYTGKAIDLDDLLSNNSKYDIDHIYPRHYIKDDSLDNNLVLVEKEINNDIKGGDYPLAPNIQEKMGAFWRGLLKKGFITKEKFNRLVRKIEFTEQEQADFIARQLVETRQGTKAVTHILKQAFPETKIIFSKAGVVSSFRQKYDLPKVRCLNSCHHAHDAYLNIVVGNTYYIKFTANPLNFIKEAGKKWRDPFYHYHMDKVFDYVVERNGETAWIPQNDNNPGTIKTVKRMLSKASVIMTYKAEITHGCLFRKVTIKSADVAKKHPDAYYPVKTNDARLSNVSKYGGISDIATSSYALVQYTIKGKTDEKDKKVRQLISIPIYLNISGFKEKMIEYVEERVRRSHKAKVENVSIRKYPVQFGSTAIINEHKCLIRGVTGDSIALESFSPLYLSVKNTAYLGKVEKAVKLDDYQEMSEGELVITLQRNVALYTELMSKLCCSAFSGRSNSIYEPLKEGFEPFKALSIKEQCLVLMQIVLWVNSAVQDVDFTKIGGKKAAGFYKMNSNITNLFSAYLLEMSPTGLFERRVNLLEI